MKAGCGPGFLTFAVLFLISGRIVAAPMPLAPDGLSATLADADVRLEWQPVSTDIYGDPASEAGYRVYASTSPRFAPDFDTQSNLLAVTEDAFFVHSNAVSSATNLFYYVTALTEDGTESLVVSEQLFVQRTEITCPPGEQRFAWIAVADSIAATNASELAAELGTVGQVYRFNPDNQAYDAWDVGAVSGTNFPVATGDIVAVRFMDDAALMLMGRQSPGQSFDWTHVANRFNRHWVSFPPNSPVTDAADLVEAIPHSTKAARYDTGTENFESWFLLGGIWRGTNFPVRPGEPVQVSIGMDSAWEMPTLYPEVTVDVTNGIGFIDLHDLVATSTVASAAWPIVEYAWDYDGDGVFDSIDSTPAPEIRHTLASAGTVRPTLRVRNAGGFYAVAHAPYTGIALDMAFSNQAFSAGLNETGTVSYTVSHEGTFSTFIYDDEGNLVRVLENDVWHAAGEVVLQWDGLDQDGNLVEPGAYHVVVEQTVGASTAVFNPIHLLMGSNVTAELTGIQVAAAFDPYAGGRFPIRYELPAAAAVTIIIENDLGDTISVVCSNTMRAAGTHTVYWDGRMLSGSLIEPGQIFNVIISATAIGGNVMIVDSPVPSIENLHASAPRFIPALNPYGMGINNLILLYDLRAECDIRIEVRSATGTLVQTALAPGKTAGANQTAWPGTDATGKLVATGLYCVTLIPESGTLRGEPATVWVEVYF